MIRVPVAELVTDREGSARFSLRVERHVARLGQRVLHALRVESPEFVCETEVDVVLGLTSMRERVRLVNGTIFIKSKPMGGTTIHVRVPLGSERVSHRAAG